MAGRRLASALSWRCFPAGHFQLQHPRPTADPAVPSSPSNAFIVRVPPPRSRTVLSSICMRKNISDGPSGRSWCRYLTEIVFIKALCTWLSRHLLIPRIELSALLGPQAWHGYGFSSAYLGEVRGCRRACERTPLRGRRHCAAVGRHCTCTRYKIQFALFYRKDVQRGHVATAI
jgi:hypothetical protein